MASPTARRVVWTGAIASITVVGTLCGAWLKDDREVEQVGSRVECLTLADYCLLAGDARSAGDLGSAANRDARSPKEQIDGAARRVPKETI